MKRQYAIGERDDVNFFFGREVEKTPAHGQMTLFVTGLHHPDKINEYLTHSAGIEHIFFGANHSFNPTNPLEWQRWEDMIDHFLSQNWTCSLDIPLSLAEQFLECSLNEHSNFIPQIRVPLPYAKLWNYNTTIKIDDKDFDATNAGVWVHSLHELMDREAFTGWSQYQNDEVL